MSKIEGGLLIACTLAAEGVTHLTTLCGGHIAPIMHGCRELGIRVIDTRHEAAAVHMASGFAEVTGKPAVALVTPEYVSSTFRYMLSGRTGPAFLTFPIEIPYAKVDEKEVPVVTRQKVARPYEKMVQGLGGHDEFVTEPKDIRQALERAFASGKPACINVVTHGHVVPRMW